MEVINLTEDTMVVQLHTIENIFLGYLEIIHNINSDPIQYTLDLIIGGQFTFRSQRELEIALINEIALCYEDQALSPWNRYETEFKIKGSKMAISTLAKKSGILDYHGNIVDPQNLERDVALLLKQHGYKMSINHAIRKILNLSEDMKNHLI